MSPLIAEIFVQEKEKGEWRNFATIKPGESRSIEDYSTGKKQVVVFDCAKDDSYSSIRRGEFNPIQAIRAVVPPAELNAQTILREGGFPLEIDIKTNNSATFRKIKLTHQKGK
jgi:hypothetical protein